MFYPHNYTCRDVASCSYVTSNKHFIKCTSTRQCAENCKCVISFTTATYEVNMIILLNSKRSQAQRE